MAVGQVSVKVVLDTAASSNREDHVRHGVSNVRIGVDHRLASLQDRENVRQADSHFPQETLAPTVPACGTRGNVRLHSHCVVLACNLKEVQQALHAAKAVEEVRNDQEEGKSHEWHTEQRFAGGQGQYGQAAQKEREKADQAVRNPDSHFRILWRISKWEPI